MTKEEWNRVNIGLVKLLHTMNGMEEERPNINLQELRDITIDIYDWLHDEIKVEGGDDRR